MAVGQYLTVAHLDTKTLTRIFAKIRVDPATGCWLWTAALNTYGYGQIWYQGADALTHRVLYAWLVEPLPRGHGRDIPQIDHIVCNRTMCCNPAHLVVVTLQANVLRSNSVSGVSARKTHCKRGHLLPDFNRLPCGKQVFRRGRRCLVCAAAHQRARYWRQHHIPTG